MGTSYHEHPDDNLRPPNEWYDSPDARRLLGTQYATSLRDIGVDLDRAGTGLDAYQLKHRAGQAVIGAFRCGFLRKIPNLGPLIDWHTASGENDRQEITDRIGREPHAVFVRCPSNLFLEIVGGHKEHVRVRPDGTVELLGPKLDDGILPAIDPVAFKRGNAAAACRFLADTIGREVGAAEAATRTTPSAQSVPEIAREIAERIAAIPNQIVSSFVLRTGQLRINLINQMTDEIGMRIFPVITWIERNRPLSAKLEKARLFQLQDDAQRCAGLDIPEYAGGVVKREKGAPLSENVKKVGELSVFCLMFSKALLGWAEEIESATPKPQYGKAAAGTADLNASGNEKRKHSEISMAAATNIDIFISHSSRDSKLAKELIELFRASLNLPAKGIRCTSVSGYKLPGGADTNEQLRQETVDAKVFVGLLTDVSVESAYVLFELGARWGARRYLVTLIGAGQGAEILAGPLSGINSLKCERDDLVQLVHEIGEQLGLTPERSDVYLGHVDRVVAASSELASQRSAAGTSSINDARTVSLSDFDSDYLMTMARPRNEGRFYGGLSERTGREAAKYQDAVERFRSMDIVEYHNGGHRYTQKGWKLCDQLWELKILSALQEGKYNAFEDIAEALVLTDGEAEATELRRLLEQMRERGFVTLKELGSDLVVEITHKGLTHRKQDTVSLTGD